MEKSKQYEGTITIAHSVCRCVTQRSAILHISDTYHKVQVTDAHIVSNLDLSSHTTTRPRTTCILMKDKISLACCSYLSILKVPFERMRLCIVFITSLALLPIGTHCHVTDSLIPIERTVRSVLSHWPIEQTMIRELQKDDRESFAVAKNLDTRIRSFRRNGDCGRCWLQKAHCICDNIPPLEPQVKRDS